MIRIGVLLVALTLNPAGINPGPPTPPGIGSCNVRGTVELPCSIADYYYLIADIIRNAPVRV